MNPLRIKATATLAIPILQERTGARSKDGTSKTARIGRSQKRLERQGKRRVVARHRPPQAQFLHSHGSPTPLRFSHLSPTNSGGGTYLSTSQTFSRPPAHNHETMSASHEHDRHLFRRYGNGNGWMDGSTSTSDDGSEPDTAVSTSGSVAAAGWSHYPSKPFPASTQFRPGPRSSGYSCSPSRYLSPLR
ncbi:hypothetical protein M422DRAFT_264010 [Sphaerobolus stellatus SS14]|uniref:Uncharacterized protein n=1 Tax=Sphaerobolus stellatus (strain SS14) TaxID=990650 RepID=A0A0C9V9E1_SPHS4|nr:hypothetical protein M422DRAFT_264010 [Sphaerobolus stellatus SS14]